MGRTISRSLLSRRVEFLSREQNRLLLSRGKRGIEREALRVQEQGYLATTPHPKRLGAALTHPHLTTDYAEALLEIVTAPEHDTVAMLAKLDALHRFVAAGLATEMLWCHSMPCRLPPEQEIEIAWYGTSHMGMLKHVYRRGLALRYGKTMQCIAGVHYNFSVAPTLWRRLTEAEGASSSGLRVQSSGYIALIRNFRRYAWLLMYLFGASPALARNFYSRRPLELERLSEDTLYLPYATSLRMSDAGYQNDAQTSLASDYNDLDSYIGRLTEAMNEPYPPYVDVGVKRDGEWIQLNTSRLQLESEYYSAIRPKRVAKSGETPLQALSKRGVQYVEVRCLDIDPFEPVGIHVQTCLFLDTFLHYCALAESPLTDSRELRENGDNLSFTAREGRRPGLLLRRNGSGVPLSTWATELLDELEEVAHLLDSQRTDGAHAKALAAQKEKVRDVELTLSARVMAAIRQERGSFPAFALRQSKAHAEHFLARRLTGEEVAAFDRQARDSLAAQEHAERTQSGDFEDFIDRYQASRFRSHLKNEMPTNAAFGFPLPTAKLDKRGYT